MERFCESCGKRIVADDPRVYTGQNRNSGICKICLENIIHSIRNHSAANSSFHYTPTSCPKMKASQNR